MKDLQKALSNRAFSVIVKLQSLQRFVSSSSHDDDNDNDDDQDKSSAKHNLDEFLKGAYAKQMKELNGTTGELEQSLCPVPCLLFINCIPHLCKNQPKYLFECICTLSPPFNH